MTEKKRGPGRPPTPPAKPIIPEGIPPGHELMLRDEAQMHVIADRMSDERDVLHVAVGRIQMALAYSQLLTCHGIAELARIKESKAYQSLKGKIIIGPDGKSLTVRSWADFCQAIGVSVQKADEDILNYHTFGGEEALTKLTQAGLGYRDLRKLRALPAADRDDLIAGIKVDLNDPEDVRAAIEDAVAKHEATKKDLDASRERVKKKDEKIEALEEVVLHQGHYKSFEHFVKSSRLEAQVIVTDLLKILKKLPGLAKRIEAEDLSKFKDAGEQDVVRSYAAEPYMAAMAEIFLRVQDVVHDAYNHFGNDFDPGMNERVAFAATKFETSEALRDWIEHEWRRRREQEVGALRKAMREQEKAKD